MNGRNDEHTLVAYVGEDGRHAAVARAAVELARQRDLPLILFDADAPSGLGSPLPTEWSADGAEALFQDRLGPADLERAGGGTMARMVEAARGHGVQAWAWLPDGADPEDLATYAHAQRAVAIVVPAELEQPGLLDRLRGADAHELAERASVPVLVVDASGAVHDVPERG